MTGQTVALLANIGRSPSKAKRFCSIGLKFATWFDGGRPDPAVGELTKDEFAALAAVPVKRISYLISKGRLAVTRKRNKKSDEPS